MDGHGEKLKSAVINQWMRKYGKSENDVKILKNVIEPINLIHGCLRSTDTFEYLSNCLDKSLGLYMGHGLVKKNNSVTNGEPLDSIISVATIAGLEKSCKEQSLPIPHSTLMIADRHAIESGLNPAYIKQISTQKKQYLEAEGKFLGTMSLDVVLASDITERQDYQKILDNLKTKKLGLNSYTLLELADILWFSEVKDVDLKLGWTDTPHEGGERVFDREFRKRLDDTNKPKIAFVYHIPGVCLKSGQPRPPYLASSNEERILINCYNKEDVERVIKSSSEIGLNHLLKVTSNVGNLIGKEVDRQNLSEWLYENVIKSIRGYV